MSAGALVTTSASARRSHARIVASWLTYRVVVVPVPGTRSPHPNPCALGWIIRPRPSRSAVEPLLGMPRCWTVDLVVAAPEHAAFVLPLPMLLNDPRIRVEVVTNNRPAYTCLIEARPDGVLEARVARRECVSHARRLLERAKVSGKHGGAEAESGRNYRYCPGSRRSSPPSDGPEGRPRRRISSNWARACACCAQSAAWMPWNNPSSHPTS